MFEVFTPDMEYLLAFTSLAAGLGIGASIVLYFWLKTAIIEGRLWANKVLVRDGQTKIFPGAMISGDQAETTNIAPIKAQSAFRRGLNNLKGKTEEPAQPLPESIKEQIRTKIANSNGSN